MKLKAMENTQNITSAVRQGFSLDKGSGLENITEGLVIVEDSNIVILLQIPALNHLIKKGRPFGPPNVLKGKVF